MAAKPKAPKPPNPPKVPTPEQVARREWVRKRNEAIQTVGPRPADGVTFGKLKKDKQGG
jgi:hypothetical protein